MRTILLLATVLLSAGQVVGAGEEPINFSLQIRPILSEKCFHCHGPDAAHREAKLRLDLEPEAKALREGEAAIVPGKPQASLAWKRIMTSDRDDVMPPEKAHRPLAVREKALIKTWIEQGATWGQHWAFEPLRINQTLPSGFQAIDNIVATQHAAHGLEFAPPASAHVLARRLSLDIVGLPPTPERADAFALTYASQPEQAIATYVDELFARPSFGEHWARMWLDLARYADTKGYEKDRSRQMWIYREWVINVLNADMPFDQFSIEQLAGDLLPNPTQDQIIATAFHRNTMTNDEGGTDNEEFRVVAVKDRVDTTGQVWLGLTVGCAKCHSHKYDPITQEDYYRFYALFNQTEDADHSDDKPFLTISTPEEKEETKKLTEEVNHANKALADAKKDDAKTPKEGSETAANKSAISAIQKHQKAVSNKLKAHNRSLSTVLIMRELPDNKKRTTHIHERGNFLSLGAVVEPQMLPLPGLPTSGTGAKPNRLDAARWLVAADNPLTPRVAANRIWARLFGIGLVETEEDFGSLGTLPTHPALLDWLALNYRDTNKWSLKQFIRTIVMSRTYQQASVFDAQRQALDPANRWLSRGARLRLTAEQVRDQALAVSGLLHTTIGGPSVMPQQPDGLWRSTYNTDAWKTSKNGEQYRRGLYTFWKRTTPYPSMEAFDAGSREVCQVRRMHTNTPLQALVTLNDPVYVEAAGHLAKRMCEATDDPQQRAAYGLRLALIRPVHATETDVVVSAWKKATQTFTKTPTDAHVLLKALNMDVADDAIAIDRAAWTVAGNVILNLDEYLSRN